jgi:hypothetical protein
MNRWKTIVIAGILAVIFSFGVYAMRSPGTVSHLMGIETNTAGDHVVSATAADGPSPHVEGGVLEVSSQSQRASGIVTRRLAAVSHSASATAYGEVVDVRNLIELMNSYTAARAQARKSVLQLGISRDEYMRAKMLFSSTKYLSLEKLQGAEAAYNSDIADSEAAFQNLSGLEGEIVQAWGSVIAKWIVHNSPVAKRLVEHRLSIVLITLPAGESVSQPPLTAEIEGTGGKPLTATLISISPVSNAAIQGVSYFYQVPTDPYLPVGMNVIAHLPVGAQAVGVMVPSSAVVWQKGSAWVFLRTEETDFVQKEISLAEPTGNGWFVIRGVKPGDEVVVDGSQLLLSQEFKAQAQGNDD